MRKREFDFAAPFYKLLWSRHLAAIMLHSHDMATRNVYSNLQSSLLRCGTRPNEWGAQ